MPFVSDVIGESGFKLIEKFYDVIKYKFNACLRDGPTNDTI